MREGLTARVDAFPPLSLSSLVSLASGPKDHLDWKIDTLAFFWTDEIPGFPSGGWHFQPLLRPHSQRIGEGHCCGEDGTHSFLESGSERGRTDHTPCSGQWRVGISLNHRALLPLPTHHPFGLHSSPGLASGSPQLCGIHPTM